MDDSFWQSFVDEYWEKKPGVFRSCISEPLLSADELLATLQAVSQGMLAGAERPENQPLPGLYVNGRAAMPPEWIRFAPTFPTLEGFAEGVSKRFEPGETFGVVVNEVEGYFPPVLPRIQRFTEGLVERVGLPALGIESAAFFGTYPMTPFGIHADAGNGVITFCVTGRKRFLLWPPDFFAGNALAIFLDPDPASYRDSAIDVEIEPGDMLYWPSDWYHTAYAENEEFHATFSIGFWHKVDWSRLMAVMVGKLLKEKLGGDAVFTGAFSPSGELPGEIQRALEAVRGLVEDGSLLERATTIWRRRVAAGGFAPDPSRF